MNKKEWLAFTCILSICAVVALFLIWSNKAEASETVENHNSYPVYAGYRTTADTQAEMEIIEPENTHGYKYDYIISELDYYLGINIGFFNSSNDDGIAMDAAPAHGLVFGALYDNKFALEFEHYKSDKVDAMEQGLDAVSGDMRITSYALYLNYIHMRDEPVFLTVKGGIVNEHLKLNQVNCTIIREEKVCAKDRDKDVDTSFSFGFGLGFNLYPQIVLELEHTFLDDSRSLNALSLNYHMSF